MVVKVTVFPLSQPLPMNDCKTSRTTSASEAPAPRNIPSRLLKLIRCAFASRLDLRLWSSAGQDECQSDGRNENGHDPGCYFRLKLVELGGLSDTLLAAGAAACRPEIQDADSNQQGDSEQESGFPTIQSSTIASADLNQSCAEGETASGAP